MEDETVRKKRKVVITDHDDDDDASVGSNPDVDYEDGEVLEEPAGDEEDLLDNIYE
mgnify:CR=1 FL=1